jgi:hypothetical protein
MAFFDLRLPLGWLFVIIGSLLLVAGFVVTPVCSDGNSLGLNINLTWGVVLLLFGATCLGLAWNHARKYSQQSQAGPANL